MNYRPMEEGDIDEISALLVTAFQDSPFYAFITPDKTERLKFLEATFLHRLRHGFGVSNIDLALEGQKILGVAVWAPPAVTAAPPDHSMEEVISVFSQGLRDRFAAFLQLMKNSRDEVVSPPFWNLAPIAILPEAQGKGIGSSLIRKKLREIDAQDAPCFLATQDKANVAIYERYGFILAKEEPIAESGIGHYTMLRKPAS